MSAAENVISCILVGEREAYWRVADLLTPADFTAPLHARLYEIIGSLARGAGALDVFSVGSEASRLGVCSDADVVDLASKAFSYANIRAHAEILKSETLQRRFKAICSDGAKTGDMATTQAAITSLLAAQPAHAVTAADAAKRMWDGVVARYEAGEDLAGLSTGFPAIDAMTGGLQPGRVYGIGARAKMGKTILAMNICTNVARAGHPVAIWSLEMSDEELMQRMACSIGEVDSVLLQRPKLLDDHSESWAKLTMAVKTLRELPLKVSDRTDVTIEMIEAQVRQMHAMGECKLLCIDYLGLLRLPKTDRHDLSIAHVTRRVKIIAKELRIPVILVFQLNRGSESGQAVRTPRPSDARDSGAIEQDLDAMLLLHRPSYYDKNAQQGLRLDLAIQRNGPTGLIRLDDDLRRCRFVHSNHEWKDSTSRISGDNGL
jgi:replicative DNA helicase